MVRRIFAALLLAIALTPTVGVSLSQAKTHASSTQLAQFDTETVAQAHCPRDQVVWLNIPTGIYHEKGMRWYGRTKARRLRLPQRGGRRG
jgi:hypothetical protein